MLLFFVMPNTMMIGFCIGKALGSFGYGMTLATIWSTLPDCVEYGEYVTGRRCGGLPTILFSFTGYVANAVQNEATLTVIKALNSLVPAVILIIGILVYTRYSLTEKRFDEIVEELTRRRMAAKQAED